MRLPMVIASLLVSAGLAAAAPAGRLAPKDIETTFFTGQPFTASTLSNVKFKMVFTLPGFTSVIREAVDLPANFTATVNAELKVGGIEEAITVFGDSLSMNMPDPDHSESEQRYRTKGLFT